MPGATTCRSAASSCGPAADYVPPNVSVTVSTDPALLGRTVQSLDRWPGYAG